MRGSEGVGGWGGSRGGSENFGGSPEYSFTRGRICFFLKPLSCLSALRSNGKRIT